VADGAYTIAVSKNGFVFNPSDRAVIVSGGNVSEVNFSASPSSQPLWSISGTVTPSVSASGAVISLTGAGTAWATPDASGNYSFTGLAGGSYTLGVSNMGFVFSPGNQPVTVNGANVTAVNFSGTSSCTSSGATADFFVLPYGNDAWSGTLDCPNASYTDGPFASIAKAQEAVRSQAGKAITVMLRDGTYYLPLSATSPGSLNFTSQDSGTSAAPIIWENYPGETPVVSGGIPISGSPQLGFWNQVSGNLWQLPMPSNVQPFEYMFYEGERRLRSRLQSSSGVGYYMNGQSCVSSQTGQAVSTSFCNLGTFLRVAAEVPPTGANATCPSVSNGTQSKCLDRFQYNPNDPVTAWSNLHPGDSNPCNATVSSNYPVGDIEVDLFEAWTTEVMRVNCVDQTNHIIYFTGSTPAGANQLYDYYGPTAGHRYMVENTRDAFDSAQSAGQTGVWFLDRSLTPWTLNYLANSGENPNNDLVVIPQISPVSPTGGSLLSAVNLSYVTFLGITFEMDDFLPPAAGFNNDENGESTLPAAVDCESCQNVTFNGITVRHTSASGIQIASTSGSHGTPATNDTIENSAFYDIGDSGIHIGHSPQSSDVAASVVQTITVENNIIQGYSRVFADGEGIAQGNGHDISYLHNDINDGYHAGISICLDGCPSVGFTANGTNVISQYNHIWNVMQGITADGGALYYNIGQAVGAGLGNKIENNLVHDVSDSSIIDSGVAGSGYGGEGIYLDNQSAGVDVESNVVYRVSASALYETEGPGSGQPANTFNNNILAYARQGLFEEDADWPQGCVSPSLRANITHNLFYFDLDESSGFYVTRGCAYSCGLVYNQFQNFQGNLYWRTDGGFSSDANAFHALASTPADVTACGQPSTPKSVWTFLDFPQWQAASPLPMREDQGGTVSTDPDFGSSGLATDYLLSTSPVSGFANADTNDTINNAGRQNPVISPPVIPATFPTYSYTSF